MPDHVFYANIIAYCLQNRYVSLVIYTDLFTLNNIKLVNVIHNLRP